MEDWAQHGRCRSEDPDAMFVQGSDQQIAKKICVPCPVKLQCLAEALDNRIDTGVWGGMTERERRALFRRYPLVKSWAKTLMQEGAEGQPHAIANRKSRPA